MTFPVPVRRTALAVITFVALLLFAAVYGILIFASFAGDTPEWIKGDFPTSIATTLGGLVGGVVAIGLGQAAPEAATPGEATRGIANVTGLVTESEGRKELVSYAYLFVYLVLGVAAIIASVGVPEHTPDAVKNLASVFIGLIIPIARSYFV
jgi:hypothetical protein